MVVVTSGCYYCFFVFAAPCLPSVCVHDVRRILNGMVARYSLIRYSAIYIHSASRGLSVFNNTSYRNAAALDCNVADSLHRAGTYTHAADAAALQVRTRWKLKLGERERARGSFTSNRVRRNIERANDFVDRRCCELRVSRLVIARSTRFCSSNRSMRCNWAGLFGFLSYDAEFTYLRILASPRKGTYICVVGRVVNDWKSNYWPTMNN